MNENDEPGMRLYEALCPARDACLEEHAMSGKEILLGVLALLADAGMRLTRGSTEAQCDELRQWLHLGIAEMPLGLEAPHEAEAAT